MTTATLERPPCGCPPKASTGPSVLGQRVHIMEGVTNSGAGGQRVHIGEVGKSQVGRVSQTVHIRPEVPAECGCAILLAGGNSGTLTDSLDGLTWLTQTTGFGSFSIFALTYSPDLHLYVTTGDFGVLETSPDAIAWTTQTSGFGISPIRAACWAPELALFLIAGNVGKTAVSIDGVSWSLSTVGTATYNGAAWSPELGLFVVVGSSGSVITSPNGTNWTTQTSGFGTTQIQAAAWSPELGLFVIAGQSGKLATSSDGATWSLQTSGFGSSAIRGVAWSPELGLFVAVGDRTASPSTDGKVATSPDGTNWTVQTASGFGASNIRASAWSPELGLFLAAGEAGTLMTSPDGSTWTLQTSGFGTTIINAVGAFGGCDIDTFDRTVATGWSDATPLGFSWTHAGSPSVAGGRGILSSASDEVYTADAVLVDPAVLDIVFDFQFDAAAGSGTNAIAAAPGDAARLEIHLGASSGDSKIRLEFVGGDSPSPVEVAVPSLDTSLWHCHFYTDLSSLKASIWTGSTEPAAFMGEISTASPTYDPNPLYLYFTIDFAGTAYISNLARKPTCPEE